MPPFTYSNNASIRSHLVQTLACFMFSSKCNSYICILL